jgi:amino acid transporter
MAVLAVAVFAQGGADSTGIDVGTFSLDGSSFSLVVAAMVGAFLSFAGFEGCAALGEETDAPERNIPRALVGCVALTTILFVAMMFAQTIGFGTDAAGLDAFAGSSNSLATLGDAYVGLWFSLAIAFTAVISGFAALLSCSASTSRLLFAMSRDGLGPRTFGRLSDQGSPVRAMAAVLAVVLVVNVVAWATGRPHLGTGDPALDAYFHYAVAGAMALMVAYFMVEIGAMMHIAKAHPERSFEIAFPLLGAVIIGTVLYYNVKDQTSWSASPFVAFAFVLVGLVIAVSARGVAARVGTALTRELETSR